ncbi:two-component system sensor histidine kinase NtrB [Salipaludibacillus sp. CF4.18]|uniref:two-component system sensor histidine kinase NtrB n=1 Tax=Salipaludibacillus sp. CF4.18 TaxID=3373081 RepID=UPI003EE45BFB
MNPAKFKYKIDMVQVLESISEASFFLNSDWEIEFINKAAEPFLVENNKDLIGMSIWEALPKYKDTPTHEKLLQIYENQKPATFEMIGLYNKNWLEVKVFPNSTGLFVMFSDITDRKKSEKQKQHYEKLKVIGEMAAGVAHEVRNPMTSVKGFLQLMAQNESLIDHKSIFNLMIDEVNRVNDIITEFLDIAKDKPEKLEYSNLNTLIEIIYPLLDSRALKEGKSVILKLGSISNINVDKNEIRQLLLNLVNNSLDAMDYGKSVYIITTEENGKVLLSIQDEGCGIPPELMDDIATPFITTKDEGTGLGVPICFSIANRNNAKIDYNSSSAGTTFNIRFSQ